MMLLPDRVALISGAAGGIGRSIAALFAEEGAQVILCDLDGKAGLIALTRSIAKELGPHGIYCSAICPGAVLTSRGNTSW